MVGSRARHGGEPSFHEPGHPLTWLDAYQREESRSKRAIKEELLSMLKLFKQVLERRWWRPI